MESEGTASEGTASDANDDGVEPGEIHPPSDLSKDATRAQAADDKALRADARSRRRRWFWVATLVTLLTMLGVGWFFGARSESPEQAAAAAEPPPASWITATVEEQVLTATVIQRGDVAPEEEVSVGVPSSVEGDPVVTQVIVANGDEVTEGLKVVEVSGRPVFVMAGSVPVYRSLQPSMEGADVRQLQDALVRLGYEIEADGVFGAQTKAAVSAFYESAGYEALPASETSDVDLAAAQQGVTEAERNVEAAQATVEQARQAAATPVDTGDGGDVRNCGGADQADG